jgi:hypothetical protein
MWREREFKSWLIDDGAVFGTGENCFVNQACKDSFRVLNRTLDLRGCRRTSRQLAA